MNRNILPTTHLIDKSQKENNILFILNNLVLKLTWGLQRNISHGHMSRVTWDTGAESDTPELE